MRTLTLPAPLARAGAALAAVVAVALALAGCGGYATEVDDIGPAAYGENGYCYWVDDPAEATALIAAGLCPAGWLPMRAPDPWLATYWSWYNSPAYYDTYVPVSRRTVYVNHVTTWQSSHKTLISQRATAGRWKRSDGSVTTGAPKRLQTASPRATNLRTAKATQKPGTRPSTSRSSRPAVIKIRTTSRSGGGGFGSGSRPRSSSKR